MTGEIAESKAHAMPLGGRQIVRGAEHLVARWLQSLLREQTKGHLRITLPSGFVATIGAGGDGSKAEIVLKGYGLLRKIFLRGSLGFAEGYLAGDFETEDLKAVFDFYMDNEAVLVARSPRLARSGWRDRVSHWRRTNTRAGSRRNIAAHYDLGNSFYRLWLDDDLNYSSGIYPHPGATLNEAQAEKYRQVLSALDLAPHHALLEIGCGWGGFAEAAAGVCGSVTGVTISQQQFDVAIERLRRARIADRARVHFQDYRDTTGTYDRIASIEMIEAVGEKHWQTYFQIIADRLKSGGKAVIQAITIRQDLFEGYKRNPDFIQLYIFPGGMLPTVAAMKRHANAVGLEFESVLTFGRCYARTIAQWRERFESAWPQICRLGYDERFRRMWLYYLVYCEVGFERGSIDVGLYRFTKPATPS